MRLTSGGSALIGREASGDGGSSAPRRLRYATGGIVIAAMAVAFALVVACEGDSDETATISPTPPRMTTLVFINSAGEEVELDVEVADDLDEQMRGLMFRRRLAENAGMIFVFESDHLTGFIMKDTRIPLSIAFISADGTIIDIQDMEPLTLNSRRPDRVYRHAIEVNQGWFERNAIEVGDRVVLPEWISGR